MERDLVESRDAVLSLGHRNRDALSSLTCRLDDKGLQVGVINLFVMKKKGVANNGNAFTYGSLLNMDGRVDAFFDHVYIECRGHGD